MHLIFVYIYVALGLLMAGLAIPLILHKIRPNPVYGFRIPLTLSDREIWYGANEVAGRWLFWVGIALVLAAALLPLIPGMDASNYLLAMLCFMLGGLFLALWFGWIWARLLAVRKIPALFREEQRFSMFWVWLVLLGIAALVTFFFVSQILFDRELGSRPAPDGLVAVLWVFFGLMFPALFAGLYLVVDVEPGQLRVVYIPFPARVIPAARIARAEASEFSPLRDYGGWGVKGWSLRKISYTVGGNRGVLITLDDGRTVMLGSKEPEMLASAINHMLGEYRREA